METAGQRKIHEYDELIESANKNGDTELADFYKTSQKTYMNSFYEEFIPISNIFYFYDKKLAEKITQDATKITQDAIKLYNI